MSGHPINLVTLIIALTTIISIYIIRILTTRWFSYTLILIFLGGIIVVFIYICSLTSNEPSIINMQINETLLIVMAIRLFPIFLPPIKGLDIFKETILKKVEVGSIIFLFSIIIVYLLVSLIVVVRVTIANLGPLRAKKN